MLKTNEAKEVLSMPKSGAREYQEQEKYFQDKRDIKNARIFLDLGKRVEELDDDTILEILKQHEEI